MATNNYNLGKKVYESKKAREVLDEEFTEFLPRTRSVQEFFELYNSRFYNILRNTHEYFIKHSLNYLKNWINPRIRTKQGLEQQINEFLNTIAELGSTSFNFNQGLQEISLTVPKRKINVANLGFLILLLKGVTWAMRK